MPVSRIVKVEVSRRGPQGAINPADQARIDAAAEIAETITAVVQTATDAQAGAVAAAGQSSGFATAAQQAASTAATQAAALAAPAAADAVRAEVAADADRAEDAVAIVADRVTTAATDRLLIITDGDDRPVAYMDGDAELHLSRLGDKSVQQHVLDAAVAGESVDRIAAPQLRQMTSAEGHVFDLTDELGNWYIPRLGHQSVQDHILRMKDRFAELPGAAVTEMLKRRRVYDAVLDFGVPNDGITNASPAIQSAYDILYAQSNALGPSVLYFREGVYRLDAFILPKPNVTTVGAGWGKSRFLPTGVQSAFLRNALPPLTRANFIDVEIDGTEQTYTGPRVSTKGMFFQHWADCQFLRVYIHDTWATGLGIDFSAPVGMNGAPGGSWIIDGRFEGCGRGSQFNDPGSSGIGIGTGYYQNEPLIIARNICRGSKNFGIFLERQHEAAHQYVARQTIITDNICSANGAGIGEVGAGGTVLNSNQCNDNVLHGIYLYGGTIGGPYEGPHPGQETMIAENVCTGNGGDGIRWDGTLNKPTITKGFYTDHNQMHRNAGAGMRLMGSATVEMTDFAMRGDEVKANGGGGIVLQGGSFRALDILHPRLIDNTGTGLQIDAALTDSRIHGLTARSTLATALQTTAIAGTGALTRVDISECVQTGHATPDALTGARTSFTTGRNPGFTFA